MTNTTSKPGFGGQWVEIFAAGAHADSSGRTHQIDRTFLDQVVLNFNRDEHQSPIVVGHPTENAPAFGWTEELRVNGNKLEARFSDVDPAFEEMVRDGRFKKRSASFYVESGAARGGKTPALRHVGFLGAQPPAVKGLKDIRFAEGAAITFDGEINFSDEDDEMKDEDVRTLGEKIVDAVKAGLGKVKFTRDPEPEAAASFSEADAKKLVSDALKDATAKITELTTRLNTQASASVHDSNVSFCEKLAGKCPPAFKRAGIVEFMDSLAGSEKKITVIEFAEEAGKKVEKKTESEQLAWFRNFLESLPSFLTFGEQFGSIQGSAEATAVDPNRLNSLREKAGLPTKTVSA